MPSISRPAALAAAGLALIAAADASVVAQAPVAPQAPPPRFMVVLDAAHGGDDTGARFEGGRFEKNYTLAFEVRLRSLLGARGIQVVTTREQDVAIDANRRAAIANHADAQACVSLHATDSGQGVHLYASSLTPAQPARFTAWKTAQAGAVTRSLALAGVLNSALQHAGIDVILGRTDLPALDSMTCPAVAVEVAPEKGAGHSDESGIDDPDYQTRVANALAAALLEWRSESGQTGARQP